MQEHHCVNAQYHDGDDTREQFRVRRAHPTPAAKFVRLVKEQGMALEAVQAWSDAEQCYTKGLDADDLVESFYQGLMRCQAGLGRRAEALGTFRRMRQVLSVILGIQPSSESEALYRGLSPGNHE